MSALAKADVPTLSVAPDPHEATADDVRVVRVLSVGRLGDEREAETPASTPEQRLDRLECLRRQTAKAMGYAYPERLQRVLEIAEGP